MGVVSDMLVPGVHYQINTTYKLTSMSDTFRRHQARVCTSINMFPIGKRDISDVMRFPLIILSMLHCAHDKFFLYMNLIKSSRSKQEAVCLYKIDTLIVDIIINY